MKSDQLPGNVLEDEEYRLVSEIADEKFKKLFKKQLRTIEGLKKRLQNLKHVQRKLEIRRHDVYSQSSETLFKEDQIEHLVLKIQNGDKSKPGKYSKSAIKKHSV